MTNSREYGGAADETGTVDVKVTIPEMADVRPFWLRGCPLHGTFAELYQECINHDDVRRSSHRLERISRHFWFGESLLPRGDSLASRLLSDGQARAEVSLVLRRDLYRIGPPEAVQGGGGYTYVDAEDRIDRVVALVLSRAERAGCFDLCDRRGRRLDGARSLASHALWPAWEGADAFPDRAVLRLRPRTGWPAHLLLAAAALGGLAAGYGLWVYLVSRQAL